MKSTKQMTPMKHLKRRRLSTSVKKRNVRHRPAIKPLEITCMFCEFRTVSNVKMIRHMKSMHTSISNLLENTPRILAEDMSLCVTEDEVEEMITPTPKLLTENRSVCEISKDGNEKLVIDNLNRETCNFSSKNEITLESHVENLHIEEISKFPIAVKASNSVNQRNYSV